MRGSHQATTFCEMLQILKKTAWQSTSTPLEFLLLRGEGGDPLANKCLDLGFWLPLNTRLFISSSPSDKRGHGRKCFYQENIISLQTWYLSFFLHECFGFNFSPHENCINFAYMAKFSTSHTCHMWRISDFSTSVKWRHLKFLHIWRNFQFPHNCHT